MSLCNFCKWQRYKRDGYKHATAAERKLIWEEDPEFEHAFGPGVVIVDKTREDVAFIA